MVMTSTEQLIRITDPSFFLKTFTFDYPVSKCFGLLFWQKILETFCHISLPNKRFPTKLARYVFTTFEKYHKKFYRQNKVNIEFSQYCVLFCEVVKAITSQLKLSEY